MPIGYDTNVFRRNLPHLTNDGKRYFVTFATRRRFVLPPAARTEVLQTAIGLHRTHCWLDVVTVMPDHVHAIIAPFAGGLSQAMKRLKEASSIRANGALGRAGPLWQHESFDHILRSDESVTEKMEYICNNPVRAGLVENWRDYPWTWRACDSH